MSDMEEEWSEGSVALGQLPELCLIDEWVSIFELKGYKQTKLKRISENIRVDSILLQVCRLTSCNDLGRQPKPQNFQS